MPVRSNYSSGSAVISKQAAETFSAADRAATCKWSGRGEEQNVPFALMVTFRMEMRDELGYSSLERTFSEQDQFGEALLFDRSDPPFRKRVQIWTSWRKLEAANIL